jgi:hypothetical protein
MIKDFKEDPILMVPIIILIVAFIILFSLCVHEFKREELTEQDYYNKFCPKHFDISCDKIKIK